MALTLLLDQYTLPEQGAVKLEIDCSFEIKVTAEQARRIVKGWLLEEVSYMMTTQAPTLRIGEQIVWRVPVIFTATQVGQVGVVGEVDVDIESGAMSNAASQKETILSRGRSLAESLPPYQPYALPRPTGAKPIPKPTHPAGQPSGNPLDLLPTNHLP